MLLNHGIAHRDFAALATAVVFIVAAGCWLGRAESGEFVLVRNGQPAATIVTATAATDPATSGARELQLHVQKITGAMLPIKNDGEKIEGPRVLVGPSAATAQLGLDESQFKDQEYLIRFLDNAVILLGKEQGTSYAVHDFLERFCDVRWYGPGESQMVLPKTATLAVQPREIRRRPAFAWRSVCAELEQFTMGRGLYNQPSAQDMDVFWHRLRVGGEGYVCNHSLYGYYDRFWKKNPKCPEVFVAAHPDWFSQGYSTSELEGHGGQPPQMCYSSQGLVDQVVADARKYFDGRGTEVDAVAVGRYFTIVPMDRGVGAAGASAPPVKGR